MLLEPSEDIATVLYHDGIIITWEIPAVEETRYKVHQAFGLPHHIEDNKFIIPSFEYEFVGLNLMSKKVLKTNNFKKKCVKRRFHENEYICSEVEPQKLDSKDCIIHDLLDHTNHTNCPTDQFLIETDYFKEIFENVYFFFLKDGKQTVKLVCDDLEKDITIKPTGLLHLSSKCHISMKNRIIGQRKFSKQHTFKTMNKLIDIENINLKSANVTYNFTLAEGLNDSLSFKLKNVTVPPIERHWVPIDYHWFGTLIIVFLSAILLCFVLYAFCKYYSRAVVGNATQLVGNMVTATPK